MKKSTVGYGALIGGITSIPLLALLYLGDQLAGLAFIPFDLFDWLARVLPGNVITLGIDGLVNLIDAINLDNSSQAAKSMEQILALLFFVLGMVAMGAVIAWIIDRGTQRGWLIGATLGLAMAVLLIIVEYQLPQPLLSPLSPLWIVILMTSWGAVVGLSVAALGNAGLRAEAQSEDGEARRVILLRLGAGSLGIAVGALGLGRLVAKPSSDPSEEIPLAQVQSTPKAAPPSPPISSDQNPPAGGETMTGVTRDSVPPAPGTRPELTPTEDFYRIDINTRSQKIDEEGWVLEIAGLFDNPRNLTLDELKAFPVVTQTITLSCISNRIGGDLIGTSNWTGLPLRDLLADLGIQPGATHLFVEATDGFYETVDMRDMMDPRTLLVYGMDGQSLTAEHGFPLRIYRPDRYGMKQPKWITRLTALDEEGRGYWVERGWSKEARPQVISVIDTIASDQPGDDGRIPMGGIAWAGDRGIHSVELQVDDGPWVETTLRTPPLSPLTWVQWRYDWPAESGNHKARVRATDGNGLLQIEEESGTRPDGATGYHSSKFKI